MSEKTMVDFVSEARRQLRLKREGERPTEAQQQTIADLRVWLEKRLDFPTWVGFELRTNRAGDAPDDLLVSATVRYIPMMNDGAGSMTTPWRRITDRDRMVQEIREAFTRLVDGLAVLVENAVGRAYAIRESAEVSDWALRMTVDDLDRVAPLLSEEEMQILNELRRDVEFRKYEAWRIFNGALDNMRSPADWDDLNHQTDLARDESRSLIDLGALESDKAEWRIHEARKIGEKHIERRRLGMERELFHPYCVYRLILAQGNAEPVYVTSPAPDGNGWYTQVREGGLRPILPFAPVMVEAVDVMEPEGEAFALTAQRVETRWGTIGIPPEGVEKIKTEGSDETAERIGER